MTSCSIFFTHPDQQDHIYYKYRLIAHLSADSLNRTPRRVCHTLVTVDCVACMSKHTRSYLTMLYLFTFKWLLYSSSLMKMRIVWIWWMNSARKVVRSIGFALHKIQNVCSPHLICAPHAFIHMLALIMMMSQPNTNKRKHKHARRTKQVKSKNYCKHKIETRRLWLREFRRTRWIIKLGSAKLVIPQIDDMSISWCV